MLEGGGKEEILAGLLEDLQRFVSYCVSIPVRNPVSYQRTSLEIDHFIKISERKH